MCDVLLEMWRQAKSKLPVDYVKSITIISSNHYVEVNKLKEQEHTIRKSKRNCQHDFLNVNLKFFTTANWLKLWKRSEKDWNETGKQT